MLIKKQTMAEGEVFCKWLYSRLIKQNKNVISAELGATGSGKSYRDLRKVELWYLYHFKKEFPTANICFGLPNVMQRLATGELQRGEILIVEEAGVNLGSRAWQTNISKMFNYILQSFRSMNIGIFLNLPYLSMLDSQARHLLHYYAESSGIDFDKKLNKCKPFFVQVAQSSGKIYRHYPKVKINNKTRKVKRFVFSMPSQYIVDAYEKKKENYLKEMIKGYADKFNGIHKKPEKLPKDIEFEAFKMNKGGMNHREIGELLSIPRETITYYLKRVREFHENLSKNTKSKGF